MSLLDLASRLEDEEVQRLLHLSSFDPTGESMDPTVAGYRNDPRLHIFGVERGGRLVAIIGLELDASRRGKIRHIAVRPDRRREGLGRAMISTVRERFALEALTAETDEEAVGFYRRCGFESRSLGEKYPGVERFWCELRRS